MTDPYQPSPGMRVFGWLLGLLGGLWVLLTGGCTLTFLIGGLSNGAGNGDMQAALLFLAIGAVCILPGAGLLFGAWAILRKRKG
jgi:hypothetical protein